jgi:signal transduction histidine kinase
MEERVRQRTASLTDEIAERVRLERAVLEITERERRAIGHDLHDGLSQHLTGTALVAQALCGSLASRSPEDAAEAGKIVGLIEQGIEQTRRLAKGLLLAEIERDGLVTALQGLAANLRGQSRVACEFTCSAAVSLEESGTATHLFRIAEEATRNAVRHGRATRVAIDLRIEPEGIALSVEDNGSGLPLAPSRGHGLGLRIMAHRAAIIGATLSVDSPRAGGTRVTCRLPLAPSNP